MKFPRQTRYDARFAGHQNDTNPMSGSLFRSTAVFSAMTMVSRVLGLVRDVVIATVFGSGAATDAFFVAFKIPNFMRRLFAEGAFSQAFVPVLSEYRTQRSPEEVRLLVARVSGTLAAILLLITGIGIAAAPGVVTVFAPGFVADPGKFALTTEMLRLTFPYLFFISLVACASGVLNTYGRFGPPAFAPVLLNLALIGSALWGAAYFRAPVEALAAGVFLAGALQLLLMLPFLAKLRLLSWPRWGWRGPGVQRILKLMLPVIFGSSVAQINLLVDTMLASFLVTGSVSWLYYSDRLVEFPLGVFGVALGTVILPRLSSQHASGTGQAFSQTLDWALRWVVLIAAPATLGLALLAQPLMATLFQHGEFTPADAHLAGLSLVTYSMGLHGFILVKVLSPGFYARQDTKTPVKYAAASLVCNMVLSSVAVYFLHTTHFGHAGVALATAVAASLNAALLFRGLRRRGVYRPGAGWGRFLIQVLSASLVMGGLLWWLPADLATWAARGLRMRVAYLGLWVGVGAAAYFAVLWLTGLRWSVLRERPDS